MDSKPVVTLTISGPIWVGKTTVGNDQREVAGIAKEIAAQIDWNTGLACAE